VPGTVTCLCAHADGGDQTMKVFISSCGTGESFYGRELERVAGLCMSLRTEFVDQPEDADLILVVDIDEANVFANLRRNDVWRRFPEKSFGIYEGDNPPRFLHGLYSSVRRSWMRTGRFQSCAYRMHQVCFPNDIPAVSTVSRTPKDLMFFFAGRLSHPVRKRLMNLRFPVSDVLMQDTSTYNHFRADEISQQEAKARYWELAKRSKFGLCPRGAGTSSVRLFELMEAGISPVIIADDWVPPIGPEWKEFALFIPESEIGSVYEKVKLHESEYVDRGRLARHAWEQYFSPENYWSFILASVRRIQDTQKRTESLYASTLPLLVLQEWTRQQRIQTVIRAKVRLKKMLGCLQRASLLSTRLPKRIR
jgi:exostosin family protein